MPIPVAFDFTPDWRVLVFTVAVAFGCGTLFGLAPALQATKQDLLSSLKTGPDDAAGGRNRLRNAFVVGQVTGSVVLLVAAGMFLRALERADQLDLGFDTDGVHVMTVDLALHRYTPEEGRIFYDRLLERAAALPDVQSAGLAFMLPLGFGSASSMFTLPGREPVSGDGLRRSYFNVVSEGYFETMRIQIMTGRAFSRADRVGTQPVLIVNETVARRFWPGEPALGQTIEWGDKQYEVIGVARDGKYASIGEEPQPMIYAAFAQRYNDEASLIVRTPPGAQRIDRAVRRIALALDPDLPVRINAPYSHIVGVSLLPNRIAAWMALGFGSLGLILATVGLFGVIAYTVSQRTREIGIRIALGAEARAVHRLVIGQGVRITAIGLGIGCLVAFGAAQGIRGLLFGISPVDPVAFGTVVLLFSAVSLLASYLPARRAVRTDPMTALRQE